jgi:GNAT superfamily N-acetyltransferase
MLTVKRTTGHDPNFISLVRELDRYLAEMDGDEHAFYATYNTLDAIMHVVLVYHDLMPVACGAIKLFDPQSMEVKRMYTMPEFRGRGIAGIVLTELETWAAELGFSRCILETGLRQAEAIILYNKSGYALIPNYGQYAGVENSVCFEKSISHSIQIEKST